MTNKHQEDPWHKSPPDTTRVCMVRVAVHADKKKSAQSPTLVTPQRSAICPEGCRERGRSTATSGTKHEGSRAANCFPEEPLRQFIVRKLSKK